MTTQPAVSQGRRDKVDQARKAWKSRLIDLSRRNNLLFFRDLRKGTVDLTPSDDAQRGALLRGDPVPVRKLLPREDPVRLGAAVAEIYGRSLENLEERGLTTLYLAFGTASWPQQDGERPTEAPVLLVPMRALVKGIDRQDASLQRNGDVQINPVLLFGLKAQCGVELNAEDLVKGLQGDEPGEVFDLESLFGPIRKACGGVRGFELKSRCLLGNFSFQKMAMVKDLDDVADALPAHELIAALAGDGEASGSIRSRVQSFDPRTLDDVQPEHEFLIMDADSSQQSVIGSVLTGQHGAIQGPPGTGKSQTIANLIAELAARGKRILFVAEKRAALEVVLERLNQVGLGHLALDLHGADLSRRGIMSQLSQSFAIVRNSTRPEVGQAHDRFVQVRRRLREHVEKLHKPRLPSGLSVFALQGQRLRLPVTAAVHARWRGPELATLTSTKARAVQDLLGQASHSSDLFLRRGSSPWAQANPTSSAQVQDALDRIAKSLHETFPALAQAVQELSTAARLPMPDSIEAGVRFLKQIDLANDLASRYSSNLFLENLDALGKDLQPAEQVMTAIWALVTSSEYRAARQRIRALSKNKLDLRVALTDVRTGSRLKKEWAAQGGSVPRTVPGVDKARRLLLQLSSDVEAIRKLLPALPAASARLAVLHSALEALLADRSSGLAIPGLRALEKQLSDLGVANLLKEFASSALSPQSWTDAFRYAWLESCLDSVFLSDNELAAFKGRSQDDVAREFQELDKERLRVASERVRRAHAEQAVSAMNADPEAEALVRRESQKKSRHLPFRTLVQQATSVLTRLRPCWMASPLSVSQLLPATRDMFDIVLFDEASQVLPEDAAVSLFRARQCVVAGDSKQLPPTTFFASSDESGDEDEEAGATEGFESLLDQMNAFCPPWSLDWHYRSRDESLIAFSNRHIYDDHLITFPGAQGRSAVLSHVHVEQAPGTDGQEESAGAEAQRVVDLIFQHAEQRPTETLGVIAMGQKHAKRIDGLLYEQLKGRSDLQAFFDTSLRERCFVKNLESVQGDERDAIILSIGYGKDRTGRLLYRFGPLNAKGGERRLNVAITRARNRLTLVSSFTHLDMDPQRTTSRGVELLRGYLEYAAGGGAILGGSGSLTSEPMNAFELDVFEALERRGIPLVAQWGVSRYRIDLAARHRTEPGRFVMAIECDGATYHSAPTARDRDRLRQQHLEALGWRFHRIWSTDWFLHKTDEVERAVAAYEVALSRAEEPKAPNRPAASPVTVSAAPVSAVPVAPAIRIPRRQSIDDYSEQELDRAVAMLVADGRLRSDEELMEEARIALGFERRGKKIEAALRRAVERTRRR